MRQRPIAAGSTAAQAEERFRFPTSPLPRSRLENRIDRPHPQARLARRMDRSGWPGACRGIPGKRPGSALCRPIRPAQAAQCGLLVRWPGCRLASAPAIFLTKKPAPAGVEPDWQILAGAVAFQPSGPVPPGSLTCPPRRLGGAGMQASLARPMTAARTTKTSDTHGLSRRHERRCAARQRILAGRIAQVDPTPHDVRARHAFWPARRAAIDQPGGVRFDPGTRLLTRETFWHRKIRSSVARNGSRPFRRRPCSNLPEDSPDRALRSQTSHL